MKRCKIAERLARKATIEYEKSVYTGITDDYVDAFDEYVNHIQDHGCWRYE